MKDVLIQTEEGEKLFFKYDNIKKKYTTIIGNQHYQCSRQGIDKIVRSHNTKKNITFLNRDEFKFITQK